MPEPPKMQAELERKLRDELKADVAFARLLKHPLCPKCSNHQLTQYGDRLMRCTCGWEIRRIGDGSLPVLNVQISEGAATGKKPRGRPKKQPVSTEIYGEMVKRFGTLSIKERKELIRQTKSKGLLAHDLVAGYLSKHKLTLVERLLQKSGT